MKKLGALLVFGYTLSAGVAQAATYYVSLLGGGTTCAQAQSIASGLPTIGAGLRCLAAGDTLLVRGGTYDEQIVGSLPSGTSWSNDVRIAAYPGETVWLKPVTDQGDGRVAHFGIGGSSPQYLEFDGINMDGSHLPYNAVYFDRDNGGNPNHIRLQNLEVVEDNGHSGNSAAIVVGGDDNQFLNVNVHGIGGSYGFYIAGDRNIVDGCNIHNTAMAGIQIYSSSRTPTANIVRNNSIHDLTQSWFFGNPDSRMWGILVSGSNNQIYNNLIYGINFPYQPSNAGVYIYSGSGHKIYNNTISNNTTDGIYVSGGSSSVDVRNNIAYANAGSNFVSEAGDTAQSNNLFGVDPSFVNPSGNNFQLQSGSPAIDAGTSLSIVTTDMNGVARPQGSAFDIGAYEYRAQPPPAPAQPGALRISGN